MLSIEWDNTFSSGIPLLDTQNKHFVETLNLLFEYENTTSDVDLLHQRLQKTEVYIREHFRQEELFLERFDPDDLGEHQSQHFLFLENLKYFCQDLITAGPDALDELSCYMRDWAVFHITQVDKSIAQRIKCAFSI